MFSATAQNFQVGSEGTGGQITVTIGALSNTSLGTYDNSGGGGTATDAVDLTTLNVTDAANARTTIEKIDGAIAQVSTSRGAMGAVQNRLESTINNLSVTTENLSASESRIRDTDMAAEMVTFTKNQILQQAGTAMLGQANSVPQTVLSLLQ